MAQPAGGPNADHRRLSRGGALPLHHPFVARQPFSKSSETRSCSCPAQADGNGEYTGVRLVWQSSVGGSAEWRWETSFRCYGAGPLVFRQVCVRARVCVSFCPMALKADKPVWQPGIPARFQRHLRQRKIAQPGPPLHCVPVVTHRRLADVAAARDLLRAECIHSTTICSRAGHVYSHLRHAVVLPRRRRHAPRSSERLQKPTQAATWVCHSERLRRH